MANDVTANTTEHIGRLQQVVGLNAAQPTRFFWYTMGTARSEDSAAITDFFSRQEEAQQVYDALASGATGDQQVATMSSELLATMERAFRDRHKSAVRSAAHVSGELQGHAASTGLLNGILEQLAHIALKRKSQ